MLLTKPVSHERTGSIVVPRPTSMSIPSRSTVASVEPSLGEGEAQRVGELVHVLPTVGFRLATV